MTLIAPSTILLVLNHVNTVTDWNDYILGENKSLRESRDRFPWQLMIFGNIKYIETKKVISLLLVVIKESKKYQMKASAFLGLLMNYADE